MTWRRPALLSRLPLQTAFLAATLVLGCGSNDASVPPDLLAAIKTMDHVGAYPDGPYDSRVGDVIQDLCFDGWRNPKASAYDTSHLDHICLSDFHADASVRLVLIESCAIWCAACRFEYGGDGAARPSLSDRLGAREAKGFRVLGTLFQNVTFAPATAADAAAWAGRYSLAFPFVSDPDHQLGLFTSSSSAPFNLLVDTRTMKIVLELAGDEPSVLFSAVDDFLAQPAH